jgi:hypothetical protein
LIEKDMLEVPQNPPLVNPEPILHFHLIKSDVLILLMLIGNVLKNKSVLTFATLNYQQARKRI